MAAPFLIPWNRDPASTQKGTTATYTVPAGKYARVEITYSLSATLASSNLDNTVTSTVVCPSISSNCGRIEYWLSAGQTLVLAASNTTGTVSASGAGSAVFGAATSVASFTITIDGALHNTIASRSGVFANAKVSSGGGTGSITLTPTTNFAWNAEEFAKIS